MKTNIKCNMLYNVITLYRIVSLKDVNVIFLREIKLIIKLVIHYSKLPKIINYIRNNILFS